MKRNCFIGFLLSFVFAANLALAQQRLSEWAANLGEAQPSHESGEEETASTPDSNKKRIAFIFSQTHMWNLETEKFELDQNFLYRLGNYVQVKSALEQFGKFDLIGSLAGPELQKANVKTVFQAMEKETRPGDEIFIYWESHGASGDDDFFRDYSGEEADGYHEYLFLGIPEKKEVITDDEFADLLMLLKGRKIMLLMEACHSGGMLDANSRRGLRNHSANFSRTNEHQAFAELMDELCGTINYTSMKPLLSELVSPQHARAINSFSLADFTGKKNAKKDAKKDTKKKTRKNAKYTQFFKNAFARFQTKDIQRDHPNLFVILSSGETENSYCALITRTKEVVCYDLNEQRWQTMESNTELSRNQLPIGAPVFAFLVAISDTSGTYSDKERTDFSDVWNIVKDLIPANCGRINSMRENGEPMTTQTPQHLNTVGEIDLRPAD